MLLVGDLLEGSRTFDVNVPGGREDEPVVDGRGEEIGALVRECQPLQGRLELRAERFERDCFRLTTTIANTTDWPRTDAEWLAMSPIRSVNYRPGINEEQMKDQETERLRLSRRGIEALRRFFAARRNESDA